MITKPTAIRAYFAAYGKGFARKDAARIAGISIRTAGNLERRYRRGGEPLPAEGPRVEPGRCCDEVGCRRGHPILIRSEGDRWFALTRYTHRVDGGLSISERHEITDNLKVALARSGWAFMGQVGTTELSMMQSEQI